jgi:Family of unknown function (DUF6167)
MRRGFWFAAGAGAGMYAVVRARRVAEAFTADGLRDRLHGVAAGARVFGQEVAAGRAEAESGLRERLGLVPHGIPELAAPPARSSAPGGSAAGGSTARRQTPSITEGDT